MKTKFFIPVLCLTFIVAGCSWRLPEKITLKQNAVYKFSAGSLEPDLGEDFDFHKIIKEMVSSGNSDNAMAFYDYNPGGKSKSQQFMLRMPIAEVSIDFNDFLENSGINSSFKDFSFEQKIEIPKLELKVDQEIPIGDVQNAIKGFVVYNIESKKFLGNFESVTLGENSYFECASDLEIVITSGGKTIAIGENAENFKILHNDFQVHYYNGGTPSYGVVKLYDGSSIKSATGLTIENPTTVPVTLEFSAAGDDANSFEECTVKEGSLVTDIAIPETWKGVEISYDFEATGGMKIEKIAENKGKKTIDLAGKSITAENTTAKVNAVISLQNATIDFSKQLNAKIESDIKTLSQIALTAANFKNDIEENTPLSKEMKDYVKEIVFDKSGLSLTYTNTLPAGNNITLSSASNFIGLEKETVLESGKTNEKKEILSDNKKTVNLENIDNFDFKVGVKLPGATEQNPNRIALKDVALGDSYVISMQIEPVINWEKITLSEKLSNEFEKNDKMELPFSLNGIFDNDYYGEIVKDLELKAFPIYIFCTKPTVKEGHTDPFKNAKFTGHINLYYGKENENVGDDVIELMKNNEIDFVTAPTMKFDKEDSSILITDFSKEESSLNEDLVKLINRSKEESEEGKSIFIDYDLKFENNGNGGGIEIERSMLESGGSIGIFAVAILPLEFKATKDLPLDVTKFAGDVFSEDILRRSDADDLSEINDYIEYINSVKIKFESSKLPISGDNLGFYFGIDCGRKDNGDPEKVVNITNNTTTLQKGELEITSVDLTDKILKYYPSTPNIKLKIDSGKTIWLPREVGFVMKLQLEIETDCEIPVLGGK